MASIIQTTVLGVTSSPTLTKFGFKVGELTVFFKKN